MKLNFRVVFRGSPSQLDEQLNRRMLSPIAKIFFEPRQEVSDCWISAELDLIHGWFDESNSKLIWYETEEMYRKWTPNHLKFFEKANVK